MSCAEQNIWITVFLENINEILQDFFKTRISTYAKGETLKTDIINLKQFCKFMGRTKVLRVNSIAFSLIRIGVRLDIGSVTLNQMLKIPKTRFTTEEAYPNINEVSQGYIASTFLDIQDRLRFYGKAATATICTALRLF